MDLQPWTCFDSHALNKMCSGKNPSKQSATTEFDYYYIKQTHAFSTTMNTT